MAVTRSRQRRRSLSTALTAAILLSGTAGSAFAAGPSPTLAPAETGLTTVTSTASVSPSTSTSSPAVETVSPVSSISSPVTSSPQPTVVETVVVVVDESAPTTTTSVVEITAAVTSSTTTSAVPTSTTPTNRAALELAAPVPGVLVDANGNTFSYTVTTLADGTGYGTTGACYINGTNGYTPGDNNADDGYVCGRDTVTYRVDWNANIVTTTGAKVDFTLFKGNTTNAFSQFTNFGWSGGITGGSTLGFTGSGLGTKAQMTFIQTGARSGYWTFTHIMDGGATDWVNEAVEVMGVQATMGTATAKTVTNQPVTVLWNTRVDAVQSPLIADASTTTINGELYRGLIVTENGFTTNGQDYRLPNVYYPGYSTTLGYTDGSGRPVVSSLTDVLGAWNYIDKAATAPFRFSLLNAPAGVMVSINGAAPVASSWDGTTAYIEAPSNSRVKWFLPWGNLAAGAYDFVSRVDPTGHIIDYSGETSMLGAPDPGVGLTCETTTRNVLPGTGPGSTMPNNNCQKITLQKYVGSGGFVKKLWGLSDYTMNDGTLIKGAKTAGPGTAANSATFTAELTFEPATGSVDPAVCDVWNNKEQYLTSTKDIGVNGAPILTAIPNAKIYYTTQDLRPAGAPNSTDAPLCGDPDNTAIWSPTPPTNLKLVSGIMVVIPGTDPLAGTTKLTLPMIAADGVNFPELVNYNVRDYMGYTTNSTVPDPVYGGYSAALTVIKSAMQVGTDFESNSSLPVGQTTYTSYPRLATDVRGAGIPTSTIIARIYVDNCMLNPTIDTSNIKDLVSVKYVDNGQDPTKCGTASPSYFELEYPAVGSSGRTPKVTWTTPVTSKPGDKYVLTVKYAKGANPDDYMLWNNPTDVKTYTVAPSAVIGSTKIADQTPVEITKPYSYTLGWFNYSLNTAGTAQFIDVFPYNGDGRGTSFSGTTALTGITYVGTMAEQSTIEYTKAAPSTVSSDPAAGSNGTGGTTTWCTSLSGGACPSSLAEVTAVRFTTTSFDPNVAQYYRLSFTPTGNKAGDQYWNNIGLGRASALGLPIPASPNVKITTYASSISGYVFSDNNLSETWETGTEPVRPDYTVELIDANGKVVATTLSDANGYYEFTNIVSAPYQTRVVSKSDDEIITVAGSDVKVEAQDWTTEVITVPANSKVENVNFGIAEKKAVTIQKLGNKCEGAQAPCSLAGAEFALYAVDPSTEGATPIADGVTVDPTDGSVFTTAKLFNGVYWLVETKAPSGMELLAQPIQFTLGVQGVGLVEAPGVASMGADALSIKITDPSSYELPATGGEGVDPAAGLLAMAFVAGAAAVLRKRRDQD